MTEHETRLHTPGPDADSPDRTAGSGRLRPRPGRRVARIASIMLGAATGLAIAVFLLMDSPLLQTLVLGSPAPRPPAHSLLPGAGLVPRNTDPAPGTGVRGTQPDQGPDIVPGSVAGPGHDSGTVPGPRQAPAHAGPARQEAADPGRRAGGMAGAGPRAHGRDRLSTFSRSPSLAGAARDRSAGRARDLLPADLRTAGDELAGPNRDRGQPGSSRDAALPRGGSGQDSRSAAGAGPRPDPAMVPGAGPGPAAGTGAAIAPATGDGPVAWAVDLSGTRGTSLLADLEAMQVRAFRLRMLLEENTLRARICETSKPAFRPVWCVEAPPAPAIAAAPSRAPRRAAVPPAPELLGVAGSRSALSALLRLEGRTLRLREGERAGAWRVNRIGADGAVTMSHPSGRRVDLRVGG